MRNEDTAERPQHPSDYVTSDNVEDIFTYHPPAGDQQLRYGEIRKAAKGLALAILSHCPASADRSAAIRKIREAVMTANAAVALGPETLHA